MLRTVAVRWQLYEISSESLSSSSSPIGSLIIQQKTQENSVETTVFWGRKKQNVLSTLEEGKKGKSYVRTRNRKVILPVC